MSQRHQSTLAKLTVAEKVDLLSGVGMWKTASMPEHGIAPITMTDGTYGVRYSIPQIDGHDWGLEIGAFLSMINRKRYKCPRNTPDVRIICGARSVKVASVGFHPGRDSTMRTTSVLYPYEEASRHYPRDNQWSGADRR